MSGTIAVRCIKVRQLREEGVGPAEIARRLGISRQSVYRILNGTTAAT
ncbi:helix-turn-helix domain-containing protein [Roseobacter fucihabitans]|nr:helix-turn-helix domain-containing protein [Roseobacter litoralis]